MDRRNERAPCELIKNRGDFPSSPAVKTPTLPWPPLVRELRFHELCSVDKKKKKRKQPG